MTTLQTRYSVTVNRNSPAISELGFGTPLVFGYISTSIIPPAERTRLYNASTALTQMVTDGFAVTDPVYLAVEAAISQSPAVKQIKVGRGALSFIHAVELLPTTFATGDNIAVTITRGTTSRTYSQTAGGVSLAAEATALAALMNADASGWGTAGSGELTIAAVGNDVEIDAAATPADDNKMWYYSAINNLAFTDVGVDRGIATDLTAVEAYDSDWYTLLYADAFGAVEIAAASTWVQSRLKTTIYTTQDTTNASAGTGITATISGATAHRTMQFISENSMSEYLACAEAGRFLSQPAGETSWADKSLTGPTVSNYTAAELSNIEGNYCNYYKEMAGVGNVYKGWVASGLYMDVIRLTDWVVQRVQERLFSNARANEKINFDDNGIAQVCGSILNVMEEKVPVGFVDGTLTCTAPLNADVSAANRANKHLPDVVWGAQITSGIMTVDMTANLYF
jgi:hypothetical protein